MNMNRRLDYEGHPINSRTFHIINLYQDFLYKECKFKKAKLVRQTSKYPSFFYLYGHDPLLSNERI